MCPNGFSGKVFTFIITITIHPSSVMNNEWRDWLKGYRGLNSTSHCLSTLPGIWMHHHLSFCMFVCVSLPECDYRCNKANKFFGQWKIMYRHGCWVNYDYYRNFILSIPCNNNMFLSYMRSLGWSWWWQWWW